MAGKGSSASALAVAVGLVGGAVAVASFAFDQLKDKTKNQQTPGSVISRGSKQTFAEIQPRGLHWWHVSRDFAGANDMPRLLQNSAEDDKNWESLPVHMSPDDPFADQENYVEVMMRSGRCSTTDIEQIKRDIPRTFPDEEYFQDTDVQESMMRVLMAACVEYPEIGYVQSMNFLVGFLFLHSKTEDACFALFRRLMSHPRLQMARLYEPGLPMLFRVADALKRLTTKHAPRCHAKLEELGMEYIMLSQTWFMTLFTYSMDWAKVGPIWDAFFERGWEAPLRVALFLIRDNASQIASADADFDSVSAVMREACDKAPFDVCARSLALNFDEEDKRIVASVLTTTPSN